MIFDAFAALAKPDRIPVVRHDAPAARTLGRQFRTAEIPQNILLAEGCDGCKIALIRAHGEGVRRLEAAVFHRAELQARAQNAQAADLNLSAAYMAALTGALESLPLSEVFGGTKG